MSHYILVCCLVYVIVLTSQIPAKLKESREKVNWFALTTNASFLHFTIQIRERKMFMVKLIKKYIFLTDREIHRPIQISSNKLNNNVLVIIIFKFVVAIAIW